MMKTSMEEFLNNLHPSTVVLSQGTATVLGNHMPAVLVRNVYGQELVWGHFSTHRGKFKGKLSQNATTEEVEYEATNS